MGRPKKQPEKPVWYQNKIERNKAYEKENVKQFLFKVNRNTDSDIIEFLESKENKNNFIKELIREHMKKTKEE